MLYTCVYLVIIDQKQMKILLLLFLFIYAVNHKCHNSLMYPSPDMESIMAGRR